MTPRAGPYARGWTDGFNRGAIDALRLAARKIHDPDVRVVLDRLADYYGRSLEPELGREAANHPDDYDLTA